MIGTLRLWRIYAGVGRPALLLGPLAVSARRRGEGWAPRWSRKAWRARGAWAIARCCSSATPHITDASASRAA